MTAPSFTVTFTGSYGRIEVPPRCRKPREVRYDASAEVEVPSVAKEDAPVAFRVTNYDGTRSDYRLYGDQLYTLKDVRPGRMEPVAPGDIGFPASRVLDTNTEDGSPENYQEAARQELAGYIIIDGHVWRRTGEPRYVVCTFGLGSGHGSTALMSTDYDNPNNSAESYFRADEFAEAVEYAKHVASQRDDTHDLKSLESNPDQFRDIEILIPDAVSLITVPPTPGKICELRSDYRMAVQRLKDTVNYSAEAEDKWFTTICRLRKSIIDAGYSVVRSEERPYEARAITAP